MHLIVLYYFSFCMVKPPLPVMILFPVFVTSIEDFNLNFLSYLCTFSHQFCGLTFFIIKDLLIYLRIFKFLEEHNEFI